MAVEDQVGYLPWTVFVGKNEDRGLLIQNGSRQDVCDLGLLSRA